ncbi:tyrosine-type recombinase/integrase [Marinococcus halophilus]|uniref:tyrosine-type recombinase/integrase n=1 Tax=Marinococcus halophilus TaxID=1371 RepID=UPI0009A8B863|nr:site-specific integrase [Marinococcus halophilus]
MRGHIRKRGTKYAIVVDVGYHANGKRKQKWFSGYSTKAAAEKDLPGLVQKLQEGTYVEPSTMALEKYLEHWYKIKVDSVASSTAKLYTSLIHKQIVPFIGHIPMHQLKPMHIEKLYQTLRNEEGLSGTTVNKVHGLLRKALDDAYKKNYVIDNVALKVDPPKRSDKEMAYWTKEESRLFLDAIADDSHYLFFFLALATGMRPGEILGLKWEDVDTEEQQLYVRRTLTRDMELKAPKTKTSQRVISLDEHTMSALKKHGLQQKEMKMRNKKIYTEQGLIFATSNGTPISHRNILRTWYRRTKPLFESEAVRPIRMYDLRHTHASLLLKANVHPKIVSERLGHSSVRMTLDTYSHVIPSLQKEVAEKFGHALFGEG